MKPPVIRRIQDALPGGEGQALVLIKGFRTQGELGTAEKEALARAFRDGGWQGTIYQLGWDSSNKAGFYKRLGLGTWLKVKKRSKRVGLSWVAELRPTIPEPEVTLIAHSLGCRVAHRAMLDCLEKRDHLHDVVLLAGAIGADDGHEWLSLADRVLRGRLYNVFNPEDEELAGKAYGLVSKHTPAGRTALAAHPKILSVDVNGYLGREHDLHAYLAIFPARIAPILWSGGAPSAPAPDDTSATSRA